MKIGNSRINSIVLGASVWIAITAMLYFGVIEIKLAGHIDTSALIGFALVMTLIDLFVTLKAKIIDVIGRSDTAVRH